MKVKLQEIEVIAKKYVEILKPYCKRIEIAGSIRRRKEECADIEIVMIRDESKILELRDVVGQWQKVKGDVSGRYTQRVLPEGINLDIFIAASEDNWGNIFLIRTGNWRFSRYMMGIRPKAMGMLHRNGYLWKNRKKIVCREEEEIFRVLGMKYIPPEERSWE